ncbi:MAG: MoaD/ThiS family protein [Actinomycetota bacterium]
MAVTVKLPTILRTHADGAPVVEATGVTLAEILADLDARYPGLTDRVRKDGGLSRYVNVYVNEEDARHLGALEAPIGEGDTVSIIPAVAGG